MEKNEGKSALNRLFSVPAQQKCKNPGSVAPTTLSLIHLSSAPVHVCVQQDKSFSTGGRHLVSESVELLSV